MIKLGATHIKLSEEAIYHMKPTDLITVAEDGEQTRVTVYSRNGFIQLEIKVPTNDLSAEDVIQFYQQFAPNRLHLH